VAALGLFWPEKASTVESLEHPIATRLLTSIRHTPSAWVWLSPASV